MSDARDRNRRFEGRAYLITGAARGQGREHAVRLAAEGADLALIDICAPLDTPSYQPATTEDLDETVRLATEAGAKVVHRVGDVRHLADLEELVTDAIGAFGRLDGVVANAGICTYGRLWEVTEAEFQEMVDVNLKGVWHTLRASVPAMIDAGNGGSIVITSSGAGLKGLPLLSHYGATKWAIVGMARSLANEVATHSIRVNTIHPTAVRTPMIAGDRELKGFLDDMPDFSRSFGNMLPVGSVQPSTISDAVLWLLSDEARWVTAVTLPVDAGSSQI